MGRPSASDWDSLLDEHQEWVNDFFSGAEGSEEVDEDAMDKLLDRAEQEAAERMGAPAGPSWLDVRVFGDAVGNGSLDLEITHDLLAPLQAEVSAASSSKSRDLTRLSLAGVGSGSAVLHLEPAVPTVPQDGNVLFGPNFHSPIDQALQAVLNLHDAVEGECLKEALSKFDEPVVDRMRKLAGILDKYNIGVDIVWRSPLYERRRSRLSAVGRNYLRRLLDERVTREERQILAGRVYQLSLNGTFMLKEDPKNPRSRTYEIKIDADLLSTLSLQLNKFVNVRVNAKTELNGLGYKVNDTKYSFMSIDDDMPMPGLTSE